MVGISNLNQNQNIETVVVMTFKYTKFKNSIIQSQLLSISYYQNFFNFELHKGCASVQNFSLCSLIRSRES